MLKEKLNNLKTKRKELQTVVDKYSSEYSEKESELTIINEKLINEKTKLDKINREVGEIESFLEKASEFGFEEKVA